MPALDKLAEKRYPNGVVARGRTLNELAHACLGEIETELDGHTGTRKLKELVVLTRKGKGLAEARAIGV